MRKDCNNTWTVDQTSKPHFHHSDFHFLPLINAINFMQCGACTTKPRVVFSRDHFHEVSRYSARETSHTWQCCWNCATKASLSLCLVTVSETQLAIYTPVASGVESFEISQQLLCIPNVMIGSHIYIRLVFEQLNPRQPYFARMKLYNHS